VAKLVAMMTIIASFVLPIWLATRPSPKKMLRRMQIWFFFVVVVWAYLLFLWYPTVVKLE
jgi:hypothetical protein